MSATIFVYPGQHCFYFTACCGRHLEREGAFSIDHLVGLVVKASVSRAEDSGFESRLSGNFFGSSPTSDLKIGTPVATLPGGCRLRVSAGTGWPCVSILRLGEMESLICNLFLSVAAQTIV